ncbi:unnamed protein product [Acanthosepion pharaonis]|uniref:Uncharacterized protein n=1 Tax=Acanthosepion pharaonis TaxID=158019 RepID=A0A812B2J4_ACAPH|nr:unnamed protein product [Sepia pharaonis]
MLIFSKNIYLCVFLLYFNFPILLIFPPFYFYLTNIGHFSFFLFAYSSLFFLSISSNLHIQVTFFLLICKKNILVSFYLFAYSGLFPTFYLHIPVSFILFICIFYLFLSICIFGSLSFNLNILVTFISLNFHKKYSGLFLFICIFWFLSFFLSLSFYSWFLLFSFSLSFNFYQFLSFLFFLSAYFSLSFSLSPSALSNLFTFPSLTKIDSPPLLDLSLFTNIFLPISLFLFTVSITHNSILFLSATFHFFLSFQTLFFSLSFHCLPSC